MGRGGMEVMWARHWDLEQWPASKDRLPTAWDAGLSSVGSVLKAGRRQQMGLFCFVFSQNVI